jgi:hypothetical protein
MLDDAPSILANIFAPTNYQLPLWRGYVDDLVVEMKK